MLAEVPRSQRFLNRPQLQELFCAESDTKSRNETVIEAMAYGYTQKEVADHLHVHYATISRIISRIEEKARNKT